ncbi:DUF1493 family protein [Chitinophaga sp. 22620]|uniref:DUF1493 family protein n=1 Tax=Chitinophaga sp. 22620 TaxID=3453952 RepID=UPI003F857581
MTDEILFNRIKDFVVRQSGIDDKEDISRSTQIEDDLGVTGDDAVDFLLAYSNTFNVDVSHFMAADYFGAERNVFLSEIFKWLTGDRKRRKKTLTVGHLEKAALIGRLDETVINS